jgi:hypothetical protein
MGVSCGAAASAMAAGCLVAPCAGGVDKLIWGWPARGFRRGAARCGRPGGGRAHESNLQLHVFLLLCISFACPPSFFLDFTLLQPTAAQTNFLGTLTDRTALENITIR